MDSNIPEQVQPDPEKNLFIIKAKQDALVNAENWLRSKGWTVNSTCHVREALPKIVQCKPKFVLLCMDHPNGKVRMLPKLLQQAFQAKVIGFVENTTPTSIASMGGMPYVLYPPITGTAIERMCSKIDRDARKKLEGERLQKTGGNPSLGTTDDAVINIKGEGNLSPSHVHLQEEARKSLQQLMKGEDPSITSIGGSSGNSSEQTNAIRQPGVGAGETHSAMQPGMGAGKPHSATQPGFGAGTPHAATQPGVGAGKPHSAIQPGVPQSGRVGTNRHAAIEKKGPSRKEQAEQAKGKMLANFIHPNSTLSEESPLVESIQIAIEHAAQPGVGPPNQSLDVCTEVICFPVGSSDHHGYVLCAIAGAKEPMLPFADLFREKLVEMMGEVEKRFTAGAPLILSLQSVDFENWTMHQAQLVKKFSHLDCECAIAYFDEKMPEPIAQLPASHDMIPLSMTEVPEERQLAFDLFLHMPRNEKFVRYGKVGNHISVKQKQKLLKQGVNSMHLKEKNRYDLYRHRLQVFMDSKISLYKSSQPSKKAGS